MTYNQQIIEATEAELLQGTAWPHLNPNYEGRELQESPPLVRGSTQSRHWSEVTPGWLVQEALNRGASGSPSMDGLPQLWTMDRQGGGWRIVARIGHPDEAVAMTYFVTDAEAEAGEGGTLLGEGATV